MPSALRLADVVRQLRQHRQAAGDVEAADADGDAGLAQRAREIDRARELVRLHADEADQAVPAVALDLPDDGIRIDAGVGFVVGREDDLHVLAQHLPPGAILGQAVQGCQAVGRHDRPEPADHVAVIIVMRRLDHDEIEVSHCRSTPATCQTSNRSAQPTMLEHLAPQCPARIFVGSANSRSRHPRVVPTAACFTLRLWHDRHRGSNPDSGHHVPHIG